MKKLVQHQCQSDSIDEKHPECEFIPMINLHLVKLEEAERNSSKHHNKDFEEEVSYDL